MDDLRAGVIAAVIANVHRDPKRQHQPFQPSDFFDLGTSNSDLHVMPLEEIEAAIRSFAAIARRKA